MASASGDDRAELRANALREAVEAVAAELRLVDVADYIAYIHSEQFANIRDVVNSSIEPFFKPGALSYGGGADFELDWDKAPAIILDMEFRHRSVVVVFKLILRAFRTSVTIEHFSVGNAAGGPEGETRRLIEAMADARLPLTDH
jgi:hypothetical protein